MDERKEEIPYFRKIVNFSSSLKQSDHDGVLNCSPLNLIVFLILGWVWTEIVVTMVAWHSGKQLGNQQVLN